MSAFRFTAHLLSCRRAGRRLFHGMDFAVGPGEVIWIRGENGRGKTSMLRVLRGLASPEEGDLLWQGAPARAASVGGGQSPGAHLSVLRALLILTALGAPVATASALRIALG